LTRLDIAEGRESEEIEWEKNKPEGPGEKIEGGE
jgi:hypothetical protein